MLEPLELSLEFECGTGGGEGEDCREGEGGGEVGDRGTVVGDRTILKKKVMGGFEISLFDTSGIKVFFFDLKILELIQ